LTNEQLDDRDGASASYGTACDRLPDNLLGAGRRGRRSSTRSSPRHPGYDPERIVVHRVSKKGIDAGHERRDRDDMLRP
jgi:hypothetical protein